VIAERTDCGAADFHIFSGRIVSADEGLGFVAHSFFDGTLTGNCCPASGFSAAACLKDFATTLPGHAAQFTLVEGST
jgi:hypothetical protein